MRKPAPLLLTALLFGILHVGGCGSVTTGDDAGTGSAGKVGGGGGAGGGVAGSGGSTGGQGGAVGTGHDGGAAGGGGHTGDGGQSCTELQSEYADALVAARSCDVKASGQCAHLASSTLSPCFYGCMTYVNDSTALDAIKAEWIGAGCNSAPVACPAIACLQPTGKMCVAADGGGGTCVTSSGITTN
jgi:hypothetical protein